LDRLKRAIASHRRWADRTPQFHRPLFFVLNLIVVAALFVLMIHIPVQVLSSISRQAGAKLANGHEVIILTWPMKAVLLGSAVLLMVISGASGADEIALSGRDIRQLVLPSRLVHRLGISFSVCWPCSASDFWRLELGRGRQPHHCNLSDRLAAATRLCGQGTLG